VQGKDLCESCAKLPQAETKQGKREHDSVDLEYGRVRWLNFRSFILHRRPLCQKINKGIRCTRPARIVHHLISPRTRPDLFVDEKNVIALCELDHPPTEGTPNWVAGRDWEDDSFVTGPPMVA